MKPNTTGWFYLHEILRIGNSIEIGGSLGAARSCWQGGREREATTQGSVWFFFLDAKIFWNYIVLLGTQPCDHSADVFLNRKILCDIDDLSQNLNGYFIMFSPWVAFFILSHALCLHWLLFFLVTAYSDLLFISQNFPFWFPSAILYSGLCLKTTLWFHKAPC